MRRSLRIVATVMLACAALAALVAVAVAHTARYDSTVTIHFQPGHGDVSDTFSGRVISVKALCERHRQVDVRRRLEGPDELLGTTFTDRDGHWELHPGSTPTGTYYAKAMRKVLKRTSRHRHVCKPEISNDLPVGHGKPKPHPH
jgi:hypothetical protein